MKRFKHSLSETNQLSCFAGALIPTNVTEVLPGDSIQQVTTGLIRMQPMLAPVMHRVKFRVHHWFVPFRIIWDEWEDFITGGPQGTSAPTIPTLTVTGPGGVNPIPNGTLPDYLGFDTGPGTPNSQTLMALPFRAYNKIWNEWYRDQEIQSEISEGNTDTLDVAWSKDYFTTARETPQLGPDIAIPMSDAPVTRVSNAAAWSAKSAGTNTLQTSGTVAIDAGGNLTNSGSSVDMSLDPNGTLIAGTEDAAGLIRELRLAAALQRYEEARSLYGSRYTEYLRYLGVRSSDARLQRPEYLGGGAQPIQISEVLSTAETEVDSEVTPVGDLRGHGIGGVRSNRFRRFFEEHGYVMTCISILPESVYTNGTPRKYMRQTKEDFWQKELQFIGQQEVYKGEVFTQGTSADRETWGYVPRYEEYRGGRSKVSGMFRDELDYWTMARKFDAYPALNDTFIRADPTRRIFAVPDENNYLIRIHHSIQARRLVAPTGTNPRLF